jgi:hypothetical protein
MGDTGTTVWPPRPLLPGQEWRKWLPTPFTPSSPPVPLPSTWPQPTLKPPSQPYNWQLANFNDKRHPKIAVMIEPLLMKFWGRCLVSNILTASGKWFDSLPWLDAYPTGICWLHAIATCPYGSQCLFAVGHLKKGELSDAHADAVVGAMQDKVSSMVNKSGPPSNNGKCKWRGQGRGGGTPTPPQIWRTPPAVTLQRGEGRGWEPSQEEGDENKDVRGMGGRAATTSRFTNKLLSNLHTAL